MLAAAVLLGVLVTVQLIALAWITTSQARYMERSEERHARHIDVMMTAHDFQLGVLLQRIQAPEAAVVEHQIRTAPSDWSPPNLEFDNDEEFHQTREEMAAALRANES